MQELQSFQVEDCIRISFDFKVADGQFAEILAIDHLPEKYKLMTPLDLKTKPVKGETWKAIFLLSNGKR